MDKKLFCSSCGSTNKPKSHTKGSLLIEIILWILLIFPGIIYSIWRLTTRSKVCRDCGASSLIPRDSPVAQKMLNELKTESSPTAKKATYANSENQQADVNQELSFRIAKDGKDIGEMKSSEIKQHLDQGTLSQNDYYWNAEQNAWLNLSNLQQ